MAFFESLVIVLAAAIALLQVSRRLTIPYPAMLAVAGIAVALLPGAPVTGLDPKLAMALFIAPVLLDAGFALPPRELRRNWRPLVALAVAAIVLTTAAVAWLGVVWAGLPLAAAVALGAIVAPPDGAATVAVLGNFALPRRTATVLKGESLLNDATALLIFTGAVAVQGSGGIDGAIALRLVLAAPGGVLLGIGLARLYLLTLPRLGGTLGGTLAQFVATYAAWMIADRLELSAVLCVVAYAMTLARFVSSHSSARERSHSTSIWAVVVFVTNVVAFLMMGMQARAIVARLPRADLLDSLTFALGVLVMVIVVRVVWVLAYNRAAGALPALRGAGRAPTFAQGVLVSWAGMRGLITLVAALALPPGFPGRDLIVLTAFVVVIGTLVIQGLTLGPLIARLRFPPDSFAADLGAARVEVIDAGVAALDGVAGAVAAGVRRDFAAARAVAAGPGDPQGTSPVDEARLTALAAARARLGDMRAAAAVDDDIFRLIEAELDALELAARHPAELVLEEG